MDLPNADPACGTTATAHTTGHVPDAPGAVSALRRRGYDDTMREYCLERHTRVETTLQVRGSSGPAPGP
jgi:hypothetical protein